MCVATIYNLKCIDFIRCYLKFFFFNIYKKKYIFIDKYILRPPQKLFTKLFYTLIRIVYYSNGNRYHNTCRNNKQKIEVLLKKIHKIFYSFINDTESNKDKMQKFHLKLFFLLLVAQYFIRIYFFQYRISL